LKAISGKQLVQILVKEGWYIDKIKGSHYKLKHSQKPKPVVIPVHGSQDLKKGLLKDLLKDTGLKEEDL